jgi:SAM-dependent methyltransferase
MELWDQAADQYDEFYSRLKYRRENRQIKKMLAPYLNGVNRVYDVGCGTGFFLDLFPSFPSNRYFGIDPARKMIKEAKRKHPQHRFQIQRVEDATFSPASKDLVLCLFSMNYFDPGFDLERFIGHASFFSIAYMPHRFVYKTMIPGEEKLIHFWTFPELIRYGRVYPWRYDGMYFIPPLNDWLAVMYPKKASYAVVQRWK